MTDQHADTGLSWSLGRGRGGDRGGIVFYQRQNANLASLRENNARFSTANGGDAEEFDDDGDDAQVLTTNVSSVDTHETIMLPQSTHSLLFTEKVFSLPFAFAVSVLVVSFGCLGLALWDNVSGWRRGQVAIVPANVSIPVRAAQYLSILITLTMEDEIPTSTYLLRMIPQSSVEQLKLPYGRFVLSAMMRLSVGYMFLANVFLAVIQSERVLDMFYDMLALQFVTLIDDIAFSLAKYDVLGKKLRNAATAKYFRVEFEKRPYLFRKKMTIFVKLVYIFNLLIFTGGLTAIGILQREGHFQCSSVQITFGPEIWENAWVETSPGQYESRVLVYSYFNGIYKQINGETRAGRPVYRELRKSSTEAAPFTTKPEALIFYCEDEGAWVFKNEKIHKSNPPEHDSGCPWLLRSPDTDAYDLLEVSDQWSIWVGVINNDATLKKTCTVCTSDTECNLNGKCHNGHCHCNSTAGHYGMHCHLEKPCLTITSEKFNDTWMMVHQSNCKPVLVYDRPVYTLAASNEVASFDADDIINMAFTGSRWIMEKFNKTEDSDRPELNQFGKEFHGFWDEAYDEDTLVISDPTTNSYPVGVDFYEIGETGPQHGPLGVLYPMQEPPGRGAFRCVEWTLTTIPSWIDPCGNSSQISLHDHWDA